MSWLHAEDPECPQAVACPPVMTVIKPRPRDLGGFVVRRALPAAERQMIGPFVFFDQMGPAEFPPGQGLDVRPHPHIGLATVTWLVEGEILHRDSLGSVQPIRPGEVNWMIAGAGIVHSERSPDEARRHGDRLCGIQAWVALPHAHEETAPSFSHHDAAAIPLLEGDGARVALIAGSIWGRRSPVPVFSDTVYADMRLASGCELRLPLEVEERGVYVLAGSIEVARVRFAPATLLVLRTGADVVLRATEPAHLLLLGGAAMDGPRHIWWNFVSSSPERIERAKRDWKEGRFSPVPGETEFIPLPD